MYICWWVIIVYDRVDSCYEDVWFFLIVRYDDDNFWCCYVVEDLFYLFCLVELVCD